MAWNNNYAIIIIGLIFALIIGLMYLLPKLLPVTKETAHELVLTPSSLLARYNARKELKRVQAWQRKHPPNTADYGVSTADPWKFNSVDTAIVENDTTLLFRDQSVTCALMANHTLPLSRPILYWEATVVELTGVAAIGLSTKPYPSWRLPGWHQHSVAYHSANGCVYISNADQPHAYGPGFQQDDVIGVGYLSETNAIFFTKNGRILGRAITRFKFPIYPSIGAIGKCKITVNFGEQAFRYESANVWQAGLIRADDLPVPPPVYGGHFQDTLLFDQPLSPHLSLSIPPLDGFSPTSAPFNASPPPQYPH